MNIQESSMPPGNGKRVQTESLARLLAYLAVWFVLTLVLAGLFVEATPPGGVSLLYFSTMFLVPAAVFLTARYYPRWSVAICYGAVCGILFAWPVFVDGRTHLAIAFGRLTAETLLRRILLFAAGIVVLCLLAFALWVLSTRRRNAVHIRNA